MKSANRRQLWCLSRHAVWITRTRHQRPGWWHAAACLSSCRRSSPSSALAWCPHWPWKGHHRRVWWRAAGGQPTCMYCRSELIWDFSHYNQRLMRAFFRLKAGVRFRINRSFYRPAYLSCVDLMYLLVGTSSPRPYIAPYIYRSTHDRWAGL